MVGVIAPSSRLNSLGSICYCLVTLGLHTYSCYALISRYREAVARSWPGDGGGKTPSECTLLLTLTVISSVLMPFFCLASFLKVGNLANDQIQLGFHHALAPASPTSTSFKEADRASHIWKTGLKRCWSHFCPISPFLHLVAAFLLVLPETLLTSVEVKHEYSPTVVCWSSEVDFLYAEQRALLSDVRSIVNMSEIYNVTHILLPRFRGHSVARVDQVTVSVAFVNLCLALSALLVRYASVFWYTNKILAIVFTLQLLSMIINSIFGFCSFSILYCVCYNIKLYPNVHLSINCAVDVVLYLVSGLILLLSTVAVFEYGANHFHEKFKIVEQHYTMDQYPKKKQRHLTIGCQGYVPHSCAMILLVTLAVFKAPLLYDLVALMRHTSDTLLLSSIICDVAYMVLWVVLWLCLTIKQQWQFRILDFVPLGQPSYSLQEDNSSEKSIRLGQRDMDVDCYLQRRRIVGSRDNPQRYSDPLPTGLRTSGELYQQSDIGTDESDIVYNALELVAVGLEDLAGMDLNGQFKQSSKNRRVGGQHVTFDESVRNQGSSDNKTCTRSLPRQRSYEVKRIENHLNVTADIHNLDAPQGFQEGDCSQQRAILRQKPSPALESAPLTREYRNSIRNKCGEYYTLGTMIDTNNSLEDISQLQNPVEPLPTLMSSFRDKVRESSLAASTFKEREKNMLENFVESNALPQQNGLTPDSETYPSEKRRCIAISDEDIGEQRFNGDTNMCDNDLQLNTMNSLNYINDNSDVESNSLPKRHYSSLSSDEGHQSSFTPSIVESLDISLPPLHEDQQLGRVRSGLASSSGRAHRHMVGSGNGEEESYRYNVHTGSNGGGRSAGARPVVHSRPMPILLGVKLDMGRRDSANYSLTSSQDTSSSNDSEHDQGLCSQV